MNNKIKKEAAYSGVLVIDDQSSACKVQCNVINAVIISEQCIMHVMLYWCLTPSHVIQELVCTFLTSSLPFGI